MQFVTFNTNTLQRIAYVALLRHGVTGRSRNGDVLRYPEPVLFELTRPWERVNTCPIRNANPFFHLMEAMAMLGDCNSVAFLSHFASNMVNYSDNGRTYNAFYGTRLRRQHGDQLELIIRNLYKNPDSRQEVALIWSPGDLIRVTKDKACNLALIFSRNIEGKLEMTSLNRSNDAIWGFVNGANIVHLSYFHEYVACALGWEMGSWWHFTNNLHVYTDNPQWGALKNAIENGHGDAPDIYWTNSSHLIPRVKLFDTPEERGDFDTQLREFLWGASNVRKYPGKTLDPDLYDNDVISDCAIIFNAWQLHKLKTVGAIDINNLLNLVRMEDWRRACQAWVTRKYQPALELEEVSK